MRRMLFGIIGLSSGLGVTIGIIEGQAEAGASGYLPGHIVAIGIGVCLVGAGVYSLVLAILSR
jgi:hypothetical protein